MCRVDCCNARNNKGYIIQYTYEAAGNGMKGAGQIKRSEIIKYNGRRHVAGAQVCARE